MKEMMKAAVLFNSKEAPVYTDMPVPVASGDTEILVTMKAAAVPNYEKSVSSGEHYSSAATAGPRIPVRMGVGETSNGERVFGIGTTGVLAEKAIFNSRQTVPLPPSLHAAVAAALPNAVVGSAIALLYRAGFKAGENVLINGATGFTGKIAVQLAKHYGAATVIATGRNAEQLQQLTRLGADITIQLQHEQENIIEQVKQLHQQTPIDIVLDYTWGAPAATLLTALQGNGAATHIVRFITIGATAGDVLPLSSHILRSAAIEIMGSGLGSLPEAAFQQFFQKIIPEVFELAAAGKLETDIVTAPLEQVTTAFYQDIPAGKRLVFEL